jgi:hypothetical protein
MNEHIINKIPNTFIAGWYLEDLDLCDRLKQFHYDSKDFEYDCNRYQINDPNDNSHRIVDLNETESLYEEYGSIMVQVYDLYRCKFDQATIPNGVIPDKLELQVYYPLCGDRLLSYRSSKFEHGNRKITFMTFLNDDYQGGEVEFHYQGITVSPEKGLTIMFPSNWTHAYKVLPVAEAGLKDKYVAVGDIENIFVNTSTIHQLADDQRDAVDIKSELGYNNSITK